jgi:hypothetical protein
LDDPAIIYSEPDYLSTGEYQENLYYYNKVLEYPKLSSSDKGRIISNKRFAEKALGLGSRA